MFLLPFECLLNYYRSMNPSYLYTYGYYNYIYYLNFSDLEYCDNLEEKKTLNKDFTTRVESYDDFYRVWRPWENFDGKITSGLGVSSWQSNRLDIFARGIKQHLVHRWWNNNRWSNWEDLGRIFTSSPAAVSWEPNRIDVFTRSKNNTITAANIL